MVAAIIGTVTSQQEVVEEALRRFSRRDLEATLELIDPDARWEPSGAFIGSGEEYRGHEGIRRFWATFLEPWASISLEPTDFIELDRSRLLTLTSFRGVGRASGVETEARLVHVWTVGDGKITRFQSFESEADALATVHRDSGDRAR